MRKTNQKGFTLIRLLFSKEKRSCKHNANAFTLIELLVVIAIIAVLAAVVVIVLNPLELTRRSRDATRLSDFEGIQKALNVVMQEAEGVQAVLCNGNAPCSGVSHIGSRATNGTGWIPVNLGSQSTIQVPTLPIDPSNSSAYHYSYYSDGVTYELNAVLESEQQAVKMEEDGGDDAAVFESGTNLELI